MTTSEPVLRKMLRPPKPVRLPRHVRLERACDHLFRRTAKTKMGLDLLVSEAAAAPLARSQLFEALPAQSARFLIGKRGAGEQAPALMVLDGALIDSLIEFHTLGRVVAMPRGDRPVTRIDATLCQDFLRHVLVCFADLFGPDTPDTIVKPEFDQAALDLQVDLPVYDRLLVTLDMGPGIKTGTLQFWLPPVGQAATTASVDRGPPEPAPNGLEALISDLEVAMDARLNAVRVPIRTLATLSQDTVIPLPADVMTRVQIAGAAGEVIGTAKLGQFEGMRALRILSMIGRDTVAEATPEIPPDPLAQEAAENFATSLAQMPGLEVSEEPMPDLPIEPAPLPDLPDPMGEGDDFPAMAAAPLGEDALDAAMMEAMQGASEADEPAISDTGS